MTGSQVRAWLPVVAWCAVIFAFSAVPSLGTGLGTWDLVLRKLAHVIEYAILAVLLVRATQRPAVAIALGTLYAVSDELHQTFVRGREGRPRDVLIDTAGVVIGVVAARVRTGRRVTA
jgi:VanZ family protein